MTFYFYDLETSGTNPRSGRIMQFAGQRTDTDLNPIGEPDNFLIKMTADTLPEPDAVLVTGITPQQTQLEGITEAEFLKFFSREICIDGTIFVGYNSVRFDDEFMRFMLWRNFYDAYEWQWKNGCSRWDLLDVVRMTRALRPDGIKWPFASDGKPSNQLELLSSVNKLDHQNAHDALNDVRAVIAVAKLIKEKHPKLFDYLMKLRGKTPVKALVTTKKPVVYTSGRYPAEHEKTTLAVMVADAPKGNGALMYDLRVDPQEFTKLSTKELASLWKKKREKDEPMFPVKLLSYNRCPAVAPQSVLDQKSIERLKLDMGNIGRNLELLEQATDFVKKVTEAYDQMMTERQTTLIANDMTVDGQLYEGFVNDLDRVKMSAVRAAKPSELDMSHFEFKDQRLNLLLPLYKARNFPKAMNGEELDWWEKYRARKLTEGGPESPIARYFSRLEELSAAPGLNDEKRYLLEELNLYGQSILPV